MGNLYFGIAMARRGWLQPSDILNTLDAGVYRGSASVNRGAAPKQQGALRAASIDL